MRLRWEVRWNGELVDPEKVARRTKKVVGLTKQNHRLQGTSYTFTKQVPSLTQYRHKGLDAGPVPVRPFHCRVFILGPCCSAKMGPSGSGIEVKSPNAASIQCDDSRSTIACGRDSSHGRDLRSQASVSSILSTSGSIHSSSNNMLHQNLLGSPERFMESTLSAAVQGGRMTTSPDSADHQQNDGHGLPSLNAENYAGHPSRHQSPETPAVTSPLILTSRKTAAAPATSATSAVSHLSLHGRLSWKDFLPGSQQSCAMMSLVNSLKHSSLNDRHDFLSKTPEMSSMKY